MTKKKQDDDETEDDQPRSKPKEFVPDYTTIKGLAGTDFSDVCYELSRVEAQIKELKAREKELREVGAALLIKAKVKTVLWQGARATRRDGVSSHISAELLNKNKVSWAVIEKSTVRTKWTTFQLTFPKKEKSE